MTAGLSLQSEKIIPLNRIMPLLRICFQDMLRKQKSGDAFALNTVTFQAFQLSRVVWGFLAFLFGHILHMRRKFGTSKIPSPSSLVSAPGLVSLASMGNLLG